MQRLKSATGVVRSARISVQTGITLYFPAIRWNSVKVGEIAKLVCTRTKGGEKAGELACMASTLTFLNY